MKPRAALLLSIGLCAAPAGAATLKGRLLGAKPADLAGYAVWIEGGEDLPPIAHEPARLTVNQIDRGSLRRSRRCAPATRSPS
jgi:hypothetical protein